MHRYLGGRYVLAEFLAFNVVNLGVIWAIGLLFMLFDLTQWPSFIKRYKISEPHRNTNKQLDRFKLLRVFLVVLLNQLTTISFICSSYYIKYSLLGWEPQRRLPSLGRFLYEWGVCLLSREVLFYYTHRALHHPLLYKWVHRYHHSEWKVPIALTTYYAHPIEHLFNNLAPIVAGMCPGSKV